MEIYSRNQKAEQTTLGFLRPGDTFKFSPVSENIFMSVEDPNTYYGEDKAYVNILTGKIEEIPKETVVWRCHGMFVQ